MDIVTLNVGQGDLAVIRHNGEAIITDARIPPADDDTVANVKGILATCLKGHNVRGLILTSFDSDHADATGVSLILNKYRPDWILYSKYFKDTDEASRVFKIIQQHEKERLNTAKPFYRHSVRVDNVNSRFLPALSSCFSFELFSPHVDDMDSSNDSSIVLRLTGLGPGGFSYLITGDTENPRWEVINKIYRNALTSDVMAAPHHGSKNSANAETLILVDPNTVLISAGVDNQYGHPDREAVNAYVRVAKHVFSTNVNGGVSLITSPIGRGDFETETF